MKWVLALVTTAGLVSLVESWDVRMAWLLAIAILLVTLFNNPSAVADFQAAVHAFTGG